MWRKVILLTLLSFWICGCLATSSADRSTPPPSTPRYGASTTREEVPTPRMFGVNFDLSHP
jgi:hypothetical protein